MGDLWATFGKDSAKVRDFFEVCKSEKGFFSGVVAGMKRKAYLCSAKKGRELIIDS